MTAKTLGKTMFSALAVAAFAVPLYGAVAQEHDHSGHAGHEEAAPAELTAEEVTASRAIFQQYGCSACHLLADAGGNGHIGPSLDGNDALTVDYVRTIITNGQGAMPSFGGMVSDEQLDALSRYIVSAKQ